MRLGRRAAAALVGAITLSAVLSAQTMRINGAGATFPNPTYSKWFSEYNKLHPNIQINYQPLGSGAGIRQLTTRTVFFGASDAPMTNDQQLAAPGKILQNSTGALVRASVEAVTAAAAGAVAAMPADFRVSITNPPGAEAYPIASFTWLLHYESPDDEAQSKAMVDFVKWALSDRQKFAKDLGYAPLPEPVVAMELKALQKIQVQ